VLSFWECDEGLSSAYCGSDENHEFVCQIRREIGIEDVGTAAEKPGLVPVLSRGSRGRLGVGVPSEARSRLPHRHFSNQPDVDSLTYLRG
jgi:hypothetical protein